MRWQPKSRLMVIPTLCLFTAMAHAQQQVQHWLAAEHDWGASKGFFLSVQNVANPGAPATLPNCKVQLGVGDGARWHFVEYAGTWTIGKPNHVRAQVEDGVARLWVNDKEAGSDKVAFDAAEGVLSAGFQPSFLMGPADYRVIQSDVLIVSDVDRIERKFESPADSAAIESLRLMNPTIGAFMHPFKAGKRVEIDAHFAFAPLVAVSQKSVALVDKYGQAIAADFPGNIKSDEELAQAKTAEDSWIAAHPAPDGLDRFGGVKTAAWKGQATGFYRVQKQNNHWWLISPEGNPCFYVGICDIPSPEWEATPVTGRESMFQDLPPRDGAFAGAWKKNVWSSESADSDYFIPHAANLIRKYGPSWQEKSNQSAVDRMRSMGFNGFGKWSQPMPGVPIVPVLYPRGVDLISKHPDPWNPAVQAQVRQWLEREIGPRRDDPLVVGWSISNERDAFPSPEDVEKILASPEATPARRAMLEYARSKQINPDDAAGREQLRLFYADALFDLYHRTVKQVDSNHLYMGNWVTPNWWFNEADWQVAVRHCDVIGFDRYALNLTDKPMSRLMDGTDKPMLCGEFSFPPDYEGRRGHGTYPVSVRTEDEAGERYTQWLADSAVHPKLIGVLYFQYRDQPILGRGPGAGAASPVIGENFAFGLVDITDRLKYSLCQAVRAANLNAAKQRLNATGTAR